MQRQYLGMIDWGIGGISIYKLIKERIGNIPVIYFSDTGVTPYGKMTREELVARLNEVIAFLGSKGVTHLVIGCNAASTALAELDLKGIKTEGVIKSAIEMSSRLRPQKLALIGGRRTVLSGIYREGFAEKGIRVSQRVAQPLSALIEGGDVSSEEVRAACRQILGPVKNASHLLLACTHYPAITPVLKEFVNEKTVILDPAAALVKKIARWKIKSGGKDIFLTSGDPEKMKTAAMKAFGVKIGTAQKIKTGTR